MLRANMQNDYRCADCGHAFAVKFSLREQRTAMISGARDERCPCCGQRVGYGRVTCSGCGATFSARMPMLHARGNMAFGQCPCCRRIHLAPVDLEKATP
jgi:DNA-directed RNA polymerase subunit RPC12/RpoP